MLPVTKRRPPSKKRPTAIAAAATAPNQEISIELAPVVSFRLNSFLSSGLIPDARSQGVRPSGNFGLMLHQWSVNGVRSLTLHSRELHLLIICKDILELQIELIRLSVLLFFFLFLETTRRREPTASALRGAIRERTAADGQASEDASRKVLARGCCYAVSVERESEGNTEEFTEPVRGFRSFEQTEAAERNRAFWSRCTAAQSSPSSERHL